MKTSIIICDGIKQVMLTPENDHEKEILKFIKPGDNIEVTCKKTQFTDDYVHAGMQISQSNSGALRLYSDEDSLVFIINKNRGK